MCLLSHDVMSHQQKWTSFCCRGLPLLPAYEEKHVVNSFVMSKFRVVHDSYVANAIVFMHDLWYVRVQIRRVCVEKSTLCRTSLSTTPHKSIVHSSQCRYKKSRISAPHYVPSCTVTAARAYPDVLMTQGQPAWHKHRLAKAGELRSELLEHL